MSHRIPDRRPLGPRRPPFMRPPPPPPRPNGIPPPPPPRRIDGMFAPFPRIPPPPPPPPPPPDTRKFSQRGPFQNRNAGPGMMQQTPMPMHPPPMQPLTLMQPPPIQHTAMQPPPMPQLYNLHQHQNQQQQPQPQQQQILHQHRQQNHPQQQPQHLSQQIHQQQILQQHHLRQPQPMHLPPNNLPLQPQHPPHIQNQPPNPQLQPPHPSAPQPTSQTLPQTSSQPNEAWAEYTSPAGIPYYYNSITKFSTYDRPTSLPPKPTPRTWRAYTDESSGKKYYSDGITTTWTRPEGFTDPEPESKPSKKRTADDTPKPKKKRTEYGSKAEASAAFKGLLLAKDVTPSAKWNDVVKLCAEDARWEALAGTGERKQALAEYQTKRSNELKNVRRNESVRAKEAYGRLLVEMLEGREEEVRFGEMREVLAKDDRFYAVEEEETREELFYEFVEEMKKRVERSKRNKKRETREGFISLLKLYEEEGRLSFASTWNSFVSQLSESEKKDPKFSGSEHMSDKDREFFFAEFVIQLQTTEEEKQRRILEARQRAEKAQRDVYRSRLRELAHSGILSPNTRWRSIEHTLASDPTYAPVVAQRREAPREIFEDFVDVWSAEYRRERAVLNRALGMRSKSIGEDTSFEEFKRMLLEVSSPVPELYTEIRRILMREDELSSACLMFREQVAEVRKHRAGRVVRDEDSSEDEGEIIEIE